ncbi:ABC transporter, ATP-binding protein [Selenomonas sp. oral taxon 137 str. F0430]|uniref:ABC transporter ATP-binding protein n=1 Tax=Selenomonas sp. oral taxon 137 TaxID=712531 RepID=UPI0001EB278B|nr:ABC transporter ATP-binding protein [Selenomonas sp. oral taxon 137]EFR41822.1 ABC transporter, ATP-binding protein [Selenomonas sp. oral taxon 137 str. F0430]
MKQMLKIFSIFTPKELRYCAFLVIIMIFGAVLEAVGIGAILPLISLMGQPDFLLRHQDIAGYAGKLGIHTHTELIVGMAFLLVVLYGLKNIYLGWQLHLQMQFAFSNQIQFSKEIMANYLAKPYLFHLNHNTATLLRNVGGGGSAIFSNVLIPVLQLLTELVTIIVIWLMLVFMDPFTAIVVAGIMGGVIYALIRTFRRSVDEAGHVQNDYNARYIQAMNQGLGAIKETKVMRKEAFFLREFEWNYRKFGMANQRFLFLNQLPRMIIETLVVWALLLLIIGKIAIGNSPMDIVPLLGVLALAAFRLMPSANRIVNLSNGIKFQLPLFEELYRELLAIKSRKYHHRTLKLVENPPPLPFSHEIRVEHLGFYYPGREEEILSDVSFSIPKGSFIGIVGPSGAGKTTFVDILLGLFNPTWGKITVDNVEIRRELRAWQANIAYVPQSVYLIDASVRENVALGESPEAIDDARVEKALAMAELDTFVNTQPKGVYTMVGERGVKLSGGQRQRIGIARALYQNPTVLILDEATSALDTDTEKSITDTILKFKGRLTIIAIAHRLSTLEDCDFKVQFENGKARILQQ